MERERELELELENLILQGLEREREKEREREVVWREIIVVFLCPMPVRSTSSYPRRLGRLTFGLTGVDNGVWLVSLSDEQ